ncbi:MAG TPA: DUF3048 domain-containing protein [Patescibacteria group bacterium]|nr:DUF3048 domain-containing protein [Patescibacteria group bacterium]
MRVILSHRSSAVRVRPATIFVFFAIVLCLGAGLWLGLGGKGKKENVQVTPIQSSGGQVSSISDETLLYRHPLTGEKLAQPTPFSPVAGIMVENAYDARPQAGLENAFLVIEAPVEAGISRFLAFYDLDLRKEVAEKIGPVRSARPYFIDWADEWDALYAHVGGSDAALSLLRSSNVFDVNQFWNDAFFWRSHDRFAPHNVYTSLELLRSAWNRMVPSEKTVDYGVWTFKDGQPLLLSDQASLKVEFSTPPYRVEWVYNAGTNRFERFQAGERHRMESGEVLQAENVAVLVTSVRVIDSVGRREIRTIGEGKAWVVQDGCFFPASWKKPFVEERLRFYRENGEEIFWNAGTTWIEVVASEDQISWTGEGDTSWDVR